MQIARWAILVTSRKFGIVPKSVSTGDAPVYWFLVHSLLRSNKYILVVQVGMRVVIDEY
jgi:hypothetical protein